VHFALYLAIRAIQRIEVERKPRLEAEQFEVIAVEIERLRHVNKKEASRPPFALI
jgi:hypothetical protein